MGSKPLRIFVAMPGSTMGERATWDNISEVKRRLLTAVARRLRNRLGREVEIVIEKDKIGSAEIHPSMFREAADSDVYIADLSGANPNVYLELGVRWALRDGITILISQDVSKGVPLPFNVSANRVLPYGPMPDELDHAIDNVVASVLEAMRDPAWIDSPVRSSINLYTAPRKEWDDLHSQVRQLQESHAGEFVAAAKNASPAQAIDLLRKAIDRNPASFEAHYLLGIVLRKRADYDDAIAELKTATQLNPDFADAWRELGITLSNSNHVAPAAEAFQRAVDLAPDDPETWSTLGGLRRRMSRLPDGGGFDWALLREARNAYQHASELSGNDTYPLVNVARLDLLLSAIEPDTRPLALASLRRLQHLARFEAAESSDVSSGRDPWKVLDLADTLLLTGLVDDGLAELRAAIELIDPPNREASLTSVIGPLRDFLDLQVLDGQTAAGVRMAIEICENAIGAARLGA